MKIFVLAVVILCLCRMVSAAENWKPAKAPLMTRWAKDVSPDNVHPEYPRPQMVRKDWQNLNGLWQFAPADEVKETPVGKELSGQILVPFAMESALSGVGKHHDKSWYRRTFDVPKQWREGGKRVLLHFGAVDYESTVWVNGKELGKHVGGYDGFSYDITDALKSDGQQEVIVGVVDVTAETQARGKQVTNPHGIWYTPCTGIWQTVWIESVPRTYIRSVKLEPDLDNKCVWITVDTAGDAPEDLVVHAQTKLATADGHPAGVGTIFAVNQRHPHGVGADGTVLKTWSPEDPFLYDITLSLHRPGDGIHVDQGRIKGAHDEVESYFGMRKIEVSPDEKGVPRIKLNGKAIMQVGPLDQGFWPDGIYTAPTDEAMKYDLEVTKRLGFNMIRKHVKVEPQRWYYWADKMGFLVWQDMPNAHAHEAGEWQVQFEKELEQLVKQHINSPAIIMWVPLNEGWGQDARKKEDGSVGKAPYDKAGTIALGEKVKSWDPTRLINHASGWTDHGGGDVHDIHNYPGPAAPPIEKQRAIVLGEFGGLGLPVEGHLWQADKNWGYQNMKSKEELTDRYVRLLGRLWQLHDEDGLCAGVYTQTTDVEIEVNGLLTYDREVLKVDESRTREANLGKGPRVAVVPLIKTAQDEPAEWKYVTSDPGPGWEKPGFDDSSWKKGKSGFGTEGTPGAIVNTTWNTPGIRLRREIDIPADAVKDAEFLWHHDEGAQVFINGVLATRSGQHTTGYVEQRMNNQARAALRPGKNLLAVRCQQTTGGQYIDVGLIRLVEKNAK